MSINAQQEWRRKWIRQAKAKALADNAEAIDCFVDVFRAFPEEHNERRKAKKKKPLPTLSEAAAGDLRAVAEGYIQYRATSEDRFAQAYRAEFGDWPSDKPRDDLDKLSKRLRGIRETLASCDLEVFDNLGSGLLYPDAEQTYPNIYNNGRGKARDLLLSLVDEFAGLAEQDSIRLKEQTRRGRSEDWARKLLFQRLAAIYRRAFQTDPLEGLRSVSNNADKLRAPFAILVTAALACLGDAPSETSDQPEAYAANIRHALPDDYEETKGQHINIIDGN